MSQLLFEHSLHVHMQEPAAAKKVDDSDSSSDSDSEEEKGLFVLPFPLWNDVASRLHSIFAKFWILISNYYGCCIFVCLFFICLI